MARINFINRVYFILKCKYKLHLADKCIKIKYRKREYILGIDKQRRNRRI